MYNDSPKCSNTCRNLSRFVYAQLVFQKLCPVKVSWSGSITNEPEFRVPCSHPCTIWNVQTIFNAYLSQK